jgi:hypothetical protein
MNESDMDIGSLLPSLMLYPLSVMRDIGLEIEQEVASEMARTSQPASESDAATTEALNTPPTAMRDLAQAVHELNAGQQLLQRAAS